MNDDRLNLNDVYKLTPLLCTLISYIIDENTLFIVVNVGVLYVVLVTFLHQPFPPPILATTSRFLLLFPSFAIYEHSELIHVDNNHWYCLPNDCFKHIHRFDHLHYSKS